ncbi:MAG: ABC transporter permease, partial [Bacillota bacterium]
REDFTIIGQGNLFGFIPNIVVVFILFAAIAYVMLNHTRFGKNVYAIGGNEDAARAAGIKVERNLVAIYTWSALTAAVAGVMVTSRSASGIASLGLSYELDAIAAATVGGISHTGGIGTITGVIGGILVLGVINNGLLILGVSPYLQQIIKGIIIVVAVIFDMRKIARKK